MLLILLLSWLGTASAAALSPLSCRVAVNVTGAGEPEVNGVYFEDTDVLSDGVPYFYKWSVAWNDFVLLYRETDMATKVPYWALQTLNQLNADSFVEYFIDLPKVTSDRPPPLGWSGKVQAPNAAEGPDPVPSVTLIQTGEIWSDELQDCERDCSKMKKLPTQSCATATVQGAGSAHVNTVFLQTEFTSDCVPYFRTANVTPALVMYRETYMLRTYWTIQDVNQEAAEDFKEWYGSWTIGTHDSPPKTGWKGKTTSSTAIGSDPVPVVVFDDKCSADQLKQQQQLPKPGLTSGGAASAAGVATPQICIAISIILCYFGR